MLGYLKESRGFDFTGYKRSSLLRRVQRRMQQVSISDYNEYIDLLQVNADEFVSLFNTILINVTGFFRDAEAWEYLEHEVVPGMLAERGPDEFIRVWSAGCASGEETYSLAMLLADQMGVEDFRRRVKIYATDVDEEALAQARHASYSATEVSGIPEDRLARFFDKTETRYQFRKDLRRSIIFGRNDLVQDAPISRIDLLTCRNTLMYFNAETQARVLERFHFALAPRGLLFLGKAEMLLSHSRILEPVNLKRRVFTKTANSTSRLGQFTVSGHAVVPPTERDQLEELRQLAFGTSPVAQLVLNEHDTTVLINQQARSAFGLSQGDIGKPLRDLEIAYRPVPLRIHIDQAKLEQRSLRIQDVEWHRGSGPCWYEIHINPLVSEDNTLLGISVVFHDISAARQLMAELQDTNRRLGAAYEELQSTNEELETTNEELQSTVEELETTNEELQSTNEELETMNEELQSANDELQTINDVLRDRGGELDKVNAFLESILTSIPHGVVVVDREMRVQAWNRGAEELWGLRREEAEREHLLNLDSGLPLPEIRPVVRKALADAEFQAELHLSAINRRGRNIVVRVLCGALRGADGTSNGALIVMEQQEPPR
ncbi:CheR family methyltransferase [Amycolatopsis magusensis]|uniref:CheR family methyltransferase n=1 Tax=Amycolatopsis magusensis TaxID=882444 RepID=UPI0024AA00AB|nr:CheR family methyltransferase [Amycolatopsis magusensis]MDI5979307.1 CheR family methyltransferase [Amycolatopsis magusensis]